MRCIYGVTGSARHLFVPVSSIGSVRPSAEGFLPSLQSTHLSWLQSDVKKRVRQTSLGPAVPLPVSFTDSPWPVYVLRRSTAIGKAGRTWVPAAWRRFGGKHRTPFSNYRISQGAKYHFQEVGNNAGWNQFGAPWQKRICPHALVWLKSNAFHVIVMLMFISMGNFVDMKFMSGMRRYLECSAFQS